jgi:hypothetical protein
MATRSRFVLLLLGLPALAAAFSGPDSTECARLGGKFGSTPRSMELHELDALKTCLVEQVQELEFARQEQRRAQAEGGPPRRWRTEPSDNFLP